MATPACIASATRSTTQHSPRGFQLTDIAVNLTDCVFRGVDWKNRRVHTDDFEAMMARARGSGIRRAIISGTSLEQCIRALYLCRQYPGELYCTVGVHPANSAEFLVPVNPALAALINAGGCGRDAMQKASPEVSGGAPFSNPYPLLAVDPDASPFTVGSPLSFSSLPDEVKLAWVCEGETGAADDGGGKHLGTFAYERHASERLALLKQLISQNRDVVVAVGECGLDGAEVAYCPLHVQEVFLRRQIELAQEVRLPLFLHSRDCGLRFINMLTKEEHIRKAIVAAGGGVVHSFCGPREELLRVLNDTPLCVGLNGTAFRTEEMVRALLGSRSSPPSPVVEKGADAVERAERGCSGSSTSITSLPLDRLMLETDSPWCDIRKDHHGFSFINTTFPTKSKNKFREGCCVERRNEPCHLLQVMEAFVGCWNQVVDEEAAAGFRNTPLCGNSGPADNDIRGAEVGDNPSSTPPLPAVASATRSNITIQAVADATEANVKRLFFPSSSSSLRVC